jgi:homoserine kinase
VGARREQFTVTVPASSANLGPAFDAIAVALDRHLVVSDHGEPASETHPAVRAFRTAGGTGPLAVRADFPGGRGLGYSGAARVAGLVAASIQRGEERDTARASVLEDAIELEGHGDNVAASLHGGVVVVAGGHVVPVRPARVPAVIAWIPQQETATAGSRALLPDTVAFEDAVFNVGRTALLVAALAAGHVDALRAATEDRLHQDRRLERAPGSAAAIRAALDTGAWAAWLSGSGPTVAAFADPAHAATVGAALPDEGRVEVLGIDEAGAVVT